MLSRARASPPSRFEGHWTTAADCCRHTSVARTAWSSRPAQCVARVARSVIGRPPTRSAAPVLICVQEGLCNRVRAVLSYWQVAQAEARELLVVWPENEFCNGHFLECFAPIKGVHFVHTPEEMPSGLTLTDKHLVFDVAPAIKGTLREANGYKALEPTRQIRAEIDARIKMRSHPHFVAAHIRRTDHWTAGIPVAQQTSDATFDGFFRQHPEDSIYLATDNANTQCRFVERFATRLRPAHKIHSQPEQLRQTELQDAVCDLFVCAAARVFAGSFGSSFSDAIVHLRTVCRTTHADDQHVLMRKKLSGGVPMPQA